MKTFAHVSFLNTACRSSKLFLHVDFTPLHVIQQVMIFRRRIFIFRARGRVVERVGKYKRGGLGEAEYKG